MLNVALKDPTKIQQVYDYCRYLEKEYGHRIAFDYSTPYFIPIPEDDPKYVRVWAINIKYSHLDAFDHIHCYGLVNDLIEELYNSSQQEGK